MKKLTLTDELPYWQFDEDYLIFDDLSLGVGYEISGVDQYLSTNDEVNEFSKGLHIFLNSIPSDINIQIQYKKFSDMQKVLDEHINHGKSAGGIYKDIIDDRISFYEDKIKTREFLKSDIKIYFRSSPFNQKKSSWFESKSRFQKIEYDQYIEHKNKFTRSIEAIESTLRSLKFKPKRLTKDQFRFEIYSYLNPRRSNGFELPKTSDEFPNSLTLSDLNLHSNYIEIDGYKLCFINLKTLPDTYTYASMIESFLNLPFDYLLTQNIQIGKQKDEVEKIKLKRRVTHSFSSNEHNIADIDSEAKLDDMESLLRDLVGAEKLITSDFQVMIWANSIEELNSKSDLVLKAYNDLEMSQGVKETYANMDCFITCLPGRAIPFRGKKLKSSNQAHLLPVFNAWAGNENPICLYPNRYSNLVGIDIFEKSLSSWNGIVIGSSGSGKSFSLNQLILQYYMQVDKPHIVWIDNGASSKRLLEVLNGSFIDLGIDSGIRVNLFDLPKGEFKPSPSKVKFIMAVLESIFKEEDSKGLPKLDRAILEKAVFETYNQTRPNIPTLSDLRYQLDKVNTNRSREFSQILYSWTGNTAFGKMLDGETTVSLDKDLTTIELKGLDSYPELQNVMLLIFTDFIRSKMMENKTKKSLLIVDEAWKLFETNCGAGFAIEAFRTFRKFRAGIWAISQNINDFKSNPEISDAILQNTPNRIILRQSGVNWEEFQKTLSLNDREIEIVKDLKRDKGKFSELLFIQEENKTVLKMIPSPLSYWICTTDPKDQKIIDEYQTRYPDKKLIDVLKIISKEIRT
jgi:conjugal transfer ATP-binding protein TraC